VNVHQWYPQDSHCGQLTLIIIIHATSFMKFFFSLFLRDHHDNSIELENEEPLHKYYKISLCFLNPRPMYVMKFWIAKSTFVALENKWKKKTHEKKMMTFSHIFSNDIFLVVSHAANQAANKNVMRKQLGKKDYLFFIESIIHSFFLMNGIGCTMIFSFSCNCSIVWNTN